MDYTLDSYGNFDVEQQILATAAKKKVELEKHNEMRDNEISFRFKLIKGYFLRLSWLHKKELLLSIFKRMSCVDTLLKIIYYISNLYGKMAAYSDVSQHIRSGSQQILFDHDRTIEKDCLKESVCEDLNWIVTLNNHLQMNLVMDLLALGGAGLMTKLYIPLTAIYNRKILEDEHRKEETSDLEGKRRLEEIFNEQHLDDSDKYSQDHPLSIEVQKMRKKWDEIIDKARHDVFKSREHNTARGMQKKTQLDKKSKTDPKDKNANTTSKKDDKEGKKGGKSSTDSIDWIQILPIWIIKNIMNYLDQKTLLNVKKVNHYWSYASDSILKERQARKFLDQSIAKMRKNVDPELLREYDDDEDFLEDFSTPSKPPRNSQREKRLEKLMNRGAILPEMVHKSKKSQQIQYDLLTSITRDRRICLPLDKIMIYPRLIREDLLLYKSYPCPLKDVNILIDVQVDVMKQRDTLSYTLSQQLSDTFSMSEANLADW